MVDNLLVLMCTIATLGLFVWGINKKDDYESGDMVLLSIFPCVVLMTPVPADEIRALAFLSIVMITASIWAKDDRISRLFVIVTIVTLVTMTGLQANKLFS